MLDRRRGSFNLSKEKVKVSPNRPKALVVSYFYPPISTSQSIRAAKLLRYLPTNGWDVVVVSCSNPSPFENDPSLRSLVPAAIRVQAVSGPIRNPARLPMALRLPDAYSTWIPRGVLKSLWLARIWGPDVVLSLGPPPTSHVVGDIVCRVASLPWVADFGDPWSWNPYSIPYRSSFHEIVSKALESRVFARASFVTFASPSMQERYRDIYSRSAVADGFLPTPADPIEAAKSPSNVDQLAVVYVGTIYGIHPIDDLLNAMSLIRTGSLHTLHLRIVGPWTADLRRALARRPDVKDWVEVTGNLPHALAIDEMRRAQVLLIITPRVEGPSYFLPTKFAEYLAAGRPILALGSDGDLSAAISRLGCGLSVPPDDVDAIAKGLLVALVWPQPQSGSWLDSAPELDARNVARNLTRILLDAIDASGSQ